MNELEHPGASDVAGASVELGRTLLSGWNDGVMDLIADDDRGRLDRDWIWRMLSTEAYWHLWRNRADVEAQIDGAWRVVGIYDAHEGRQVGFARAVSDGVHDAYLADVIVEPGSRGHGIGKLLVRTMVDDGPGADFRWTLFTADAHGLYGKFGFVAPDSTAMVRPSSRVAAP
jgi:GNAT superfamily N-acetyltransferase